METSRSIYHRPSLEFRYALDACAAHAYRDRGYTLLIAGNELYVRELKRRLPTILVDGSDDRPPAIRTLILAEPERNDLQRFEQVKTLLEVDSCLQVIVPGTLSRFLSARNKDALGLPQILQFLRQRGFEVTNQICFHGIRSISWSYAFRFWRYMRRDDLADRSLRRMHQSFVTRHPFLTTLVLLSAERHAGSKSA